MVSLKSVVPSTLKSTEATPTLSEAFAETVTAEPETVEPFTGAAMETVGRVVSPGGGGGGGGGDGTGRGGPESDCGISTTYELIVAVPFQSLANITLVPSGLAVV